VDKRRVLVCSAWPYASGLPHLGNLVSSLLSGDVFARYHRLRGLEVLYVSGSDAHGTRIEFEARKAGVTPIELATRTHEGIRRILDAFGIVFDHYTTTMSETHTAFVRDAYLRMEENGYIRTEKELRAYCLDCQRFLADRLISGTCPRCGSGHALGDQCDACGTMLEPEELVNPVCSFCGRREIEFRETAHWYLDLPKLAPALREYVAASGFQGNVRWFTKQMIDDGLRPRAITRDIDWGIPAPFHGAEEKVIYVWGEAVLGYVSAVIERFCGGSEWEKYWLGDDVHQIYTMGKDNITFHSLILPALLTATKVGYHLPDQIAATEYLNWIGGESFSKTRGVGLYCDDALRAMDAEFWRFYLLYNRPEARDVDFSWEELEKAVNGILISNVANLINRVVALVQTRFEGVVPMASTDAEVAARIAAVVAAYEAAIDQGMLGQALRAACDLAVFGNHYVQQKKTWSTNDATAVNGSVEIAKTLAILLLPYVPEFGGAVLRVLGFERPQWNDINTAMGGRKLRDERILLQRIDIAEMRAKIEGQTPAPKPAAAESAVIVSYEDFQRLDLRVGVVRDVQPVEGAERLWRLSVDLGTAVRACVAGLRGSYEAEALVGRTVVVLANLEPRAIRGVRSEVMVLTAQGETAALIGPDRPVDPGCAVR
jgi:methionyl-tRNA synthetase